MLLLTSSLILESRLTSETIAVHSGECSLGSRSLRQELSSMEATVEVNAKCLVSNKSTKEGTCQKTLPLVGVPPKLLHE